MLMSIRVKSGIQEGTECRTAQERDFPAGCFRLLPPSSRSCCRRVRQPVTTAVATAVSDKIAPTISVTSPAAGQTYAGTVNVTGTIFDDALSNGDHKGTLKSIDYTVANDVLRRGGLLINPDGTTTVDTKFGSGVITWVSATHAYSFSLSTTTPSVLAGLLSITIDATDANGNVQSQIVQMSDGSGPVIAVTSPTSSFKYAFNGTSTLTLTGTIHNSPTDSTSTNIKTLTWGVDLQSTWGATITVVPPTTSYSVVNGPGPLYSLQPFTFDTSTGAFAAKFQIPALTPTTISLFLRVTATDFNNHTNSATILMAAAGASAPSMLLTGKPTYYSKTIYVPGTVAGNIAPTEIASVGSLLFQVSAGSFNPSPIEFYPVDGTGGTMMFNNTTGDFSFKLQDTGNTTSLQGVSGPVTVSVTVIGTNTVSASSGFTLQEDNVGPVVSASASSNNASTAYARAGDVVTLNLTGSDALSGLAPTFGLTVMGSSGTPSWSSGAYSAPYTVKPTDTGTFQFQITATDNAGNPTTVNTVASNVTLYGPAPTLSAVSITSNNPPAQRGRRREVS